LWDDVALSAAHDHTEVAHLPHANLLEGAPWQFWPSEPDTGLPLADTWIYSLSVRLAIINCENVNHRPYIWIIMFRVTREIEFCYGHRLLNYEGKCRHLHGHTGRAVITLEGRELDARGMLVDFAEIKQKVQHWIDDHLDHNMLLCRDDPLLPLLRERGERVYEMDCNPTAENIARLIYEHARSVGLPVVEVSLWETERCAATYSANS
jgi:6-pyruvoyltetrahydropterin/6-carboxytetrahydropterin synthase